MSTQTATLPDPFELTGSIHANGQLQCDEQNSTLRWQIGSSDAFGRRQVLYNASNDADPNNSGGTYAGNGPVLRFGSTSADGDAINVISEGAVFYGMSSGGGQLDNTNYGFARIKPLRFQLRNEDGNGGSGVAHDVFRVDDAKMTWREGDGANDRLYLDTNGLQLADNLWVGKEASSGSNVITNKIETAVSQTATKAYTASEVLNSIIDRSGQNASVTDTLPSAASLVSSMPFTAKIGMTFTTLFLNTDSVQSITIAPGTGGTMKPASTYSINTQQAVNLTFRLTNVSASTEAYTVYVH